MPIRWLFVGLQRALGWGLVVRGTNHVIRGVEVSDHPTLPSCISSVLERRGAGDCVQSPTASDLIHLVFHKAPRNLGSGSFCVGNYIHVPIPWEYKLCTWDSSGPFPMYLFTWLFICILCNMLERVRKAAFWVPRAIVNKLSHLRIGL